MTFEINSYFALAIQGFFIGLGTASANYIMLEHLFKKLSKMKRK